MKKILHLNLYRKYFDAIANGTKTIEYSSRTEYWNKRLEDKENDIIKYKNGYVKNASTMLVEYLGYYTSIDFEEYEIRLGKIIEVNYGKRINR